MNHIQAYQRRLYGKDTRHARTKQPALGDTDMREEA